MPSPHGTANRHVPVLLETLLNSISPVKGIWADCTFGSGAYSRALLEAGADHVFGIDCDPDAIAWARSQSWSADPKLTLISGWNGELDRFEKIGAAIPLDGVVFDLGVSSMQLDNGERGFSFQRDGPLDMRMSQSGLSAADVVNEYDERDLANIFWLFGEERASRRAAREIVKCRADRRIDTTGQLAEILSGCLGRSANMKIHPATRCFQALRIVVNDELGQLVRSLQAAERSLRPGGLLVAVSFHSLEDRIVKRFLRSQDRKGSRSRHLPWPDADELRFRSNGKTAIRPDKIELRNNPRSRSAKLRIAHRTAAPAISIDPETLGLPTFAHAGKR